MSSIHKIVEPWLQEEDSDDILRLRDQIVWLQKELYDHYEPHNFQNFDDRLVRWLQNTADPVDQKSMFRLLDRLFFVGREQFNSLCRASFSGVVHRWIVDQAKLDIADIGISDNLKAAFDQTWFCPVTDSMRINAYLKLNNVAGHSVRPDWRSVEKLGDPAKVLEFVKTQKIERMVLLEDFVGSGNQMESSVLWAAQNLPDIPILLIPLVCCPKGAGKGAEIASTYDKVTFAPTLTLAKDQFLLPSPQDDEPSVFAEVRTLIEKTKGNLGDWQSQPFGYQDTGAVVALFSNCPDNSLSMLHDRSPQWEPLFERITRK
jgi:hypothetical protein